MGVENEFFWFEIGSGFSKPGGTPHEEFPGVPPGGLKRLLLVYTVSYGYLSSANVIKNALLNNFNTVSGF